MVITRIMSLMLLFCITLLAGAIADGATAPLEESIPSEDATLCSLILEYVQEADVVPKKIPVRNHVINIYEIVPGGERTPTGHIIIEDRTVTSVSCDDISESPTLEIQTTYEAANDVLDSDNALQTLQRHVKSKDIIITGKGFVEKVKLAFAKIGLQVASIF